MLSRIIFREVKKPLGRWFNSGEYSIPNIVEHLDKLKHERNIIKDKKIDPYYEIIKKAENDIFPPYFYIL